MSIDWNRYKPQENLSDREVSLIREIAETYLRTGQGLSAQQERVSLDKDWRVLDDLLNKHFYASNISDKLYPAFQALYFTPELRTRCEAVVECLLKALKHLYQRTTPPLRNYDLAQIHEAIKSQRLGDWTAEVVRQGALFMSDFQERFRLIPNWGMDATVESVRLSNNHILEFEDLDKAWDDVWNQRYAAQQSPSIRPSQQPHPAPPTSEIEPENFAFVTNDRLRPIIQRDYAELRKAGEANSLKSRIVLAGGLIEAVLLDVLMQNAEKARDSKSAQRDGAKVEPLEKWDLSHLIDVAVELKLVGSDAQKHSHTIREYRNLVHPGLELRSLQTIRLEVANIAEEVLSMVSSDIRDATRKS